MITNREALTKFHFIDQIYFSPVCAVGKRA